VFVSSTAARVRLNHLVLGFRTSDVPFSDCLEVRNALEPLVCREASRNCKPRDARELRAIVASMGEAVHDPREFLALNWRLHRRLAAMCSNAPLKTLYLTLLDFVEEGLQDVGADAFYDGQENFRAHDTLIEAIIDGDRWQLERAIERHWPMASRWSADSTS
jgi:GntR family transcriptional repressor for pyruvate dehydrogenase complex